MSQVFKRELRANFISLLVWLLGICAFAGIGFVKFAGVASTSADINVIFDVMPRIMRIMFGLGDLSLSTPEGYYAAILLWVSFITFTHAALLGGTILAKEERDKTADFLFCRPITRRRVIFGKMLAAFLNVAVIAAVTWAVIMGSFFTQTNAPDMARIIAETMLGMFVGQCVFLFVGFALSAIFKYHKTAAQGASMAVLGTYMLMVYIDLSGKVNFLSILTPFRYFNTKDIMDNGFSMFYLFASLVIVAAAIAITIIKYQKRDLRN